MAEIFVSYRRRDSSLFVDVLADRLRQTSDVFVDSDEIKLGDAFMFRIQRAISEARLVIVVIGLNWEPSRLNEDNDVVAYELRTAHRFERRVIPLVLTPATMPPTESLPDDLAWLAGLNAFMMPEPPEHRAHLVLLGDLVRSSLTTAREEPPVTFSVPTDSRMLEQGSGNVPFTETPVDEHMRLCSVDKSGRTVWLSSLDQIEIRDLATRTVRTSARPGAEWLCTTKQGALTATSFMGYQAPDTIHFYEVTAPEDLIARTQAGFTWSWQFPPLALSPDETSLLAYIEQPKRRDLILFSVKDGKEIGSCAFSQSVWSMCWGPDEKYYLLSRSADKVVLSALVAKTYSIQWSRELQSVVKGRNQTAEVMFWRAPASLLVNTGSALLEADPSSGEIRRTLMNSDGQLGCLATDAESSVACIAEGTSLRIWLPDWDSFLTVDLHGDKCRACSLQGGFMAVLAGNDTRCRLLSARTSVLEQA